MKSKKFTYVLWKQVLCFLVTIGFPLSTWAASGNCEGEATAKSLRALSKAAQGKNLTARRREAAAEERERMRAEQAEILEQENMVKIVLPWLKKNLVAAAKTGATKFVLGSEDIKDDTSYPWKDRLKKPGTLDHFNYKTPEHLRDESHEQSWDQSELSKIDPQRYPLIYALLSYCVEAELKVSFQERGKWTVPWGVESEPMFQGSEHTLILEWD